MGIDRNKEGGKTVAGKQITKCHGAVYEITGDKRVSEIVSGEFLGKMQKRKKRVYQDSPKIPK